MFQLSLTGPLAGAKILTKNALFYENLYFPIFPARGSLAGAKILMKNALFEVFKPRECQNRIWRNKNYISSPEESSGALHGVDI